MIRPTILASVACLAPALNSQNVVIFPTDHATVEGSSRAVNFPFAGGVSRYQAVYDKRFLNLPNGAVITKIGVRPNGTATSTGHRVQLEIFMGHTTRFGNGFDTRFANNYDVAPPTQVLQRQIITLPTLTPAATQPSTDYVMVDLDTPFTYDSSNNLVLDFRVYANDAGNVAFQYHVDLASSLSQQTQFGQSCQTSTNTTPVHAAGATRVGGPWNLSMTAGLPNVSGVLALGASNSTWNGLPLPLSLAALGAAGCDLNVSPDLFFNVRLDSRGAMNARLTVPVNFQLYQREIYSQVLFADPFANSMGLVFSNGASTTIGLLPRCTLISATGNANAATGRRSFNLGAVMVFEHQ